MTKNISAVIIDTYEDKKLATLAIEMTLKCKKVNKVYTFSDKPYFEGAEFNEIPSISSIKDYEKVVLRNLKNIVHENFLLIQWDGFVLYPSKWQDIFLEYDYIGAPVFLNNNYIVGNGGFSYRSNRLMNAIARIQDTNREHDYDLPEDILICSQYRTELEKQGIKFAPLEVASKFSFETDSYPSDLQNLFGFHSPWGFAIFFDEKKILPYTSDIIKRIGKFASLVVYLEQCQKRGRHQLLLESIISMNKFSHIIHMIDKNLSSNDNIFWAKRFIEVTKTLVKY